jgi:uracil-DNA glycosylase
MFIRECFCSKGQHGEEFIRIGETELYEPFTNDLGQLFKALQKEHGRCTGKVYYDNASGTHSNGWVFEKVRPYEDSPNEHYIAETWVTLYEKQDKVTRESYPMNIKA